MKGLRVLEPAQGEAGDAPFIKLISRIAVDGVPSSGSR